jgi:hypothetical protein
MTYAMYSHFNKTHNINIYIYICTIDVSYPIFEVALKMETSATQKNMRNTTTEHMTSAARGPKRRTHITRYQRDMPSLPHLGRTMEPQGVWKTVCPYVIE